MQICSYQYYAHTQQLLVTTEIQVSVVMFAYVAMLASFYTGLLRGYQGCASSI